MSDTQLVTVDEFLSSRKDFVKGGNVLMKAAKAPSTWNPEARTARFVMSSEAEDRDRDIVLQAGLDVTEFMKNPIAPFAHRSTDFPIGVWSDVEKNLTGRPRRTEGTLNLVPEGTDGVADRLAFHIGAGSIRACSIGFVPHAVERREVPESRRDSAFFPGYRIIEAELVECSPVAIPSNPAALAKSAAEGDVLAREIIEQVLDEWTRHPETGLIVPRAEFEAAHKQATGGRSSVVVPPVTETEDTADSRASGEAVSLIRRALDYVMGSSQSSNHTVVNGPDTNEFVPGAYDGNVKDGDSDIKAMAAEKQKRLDELSAVHADMMKRHRLTELQKRQERIKRAA
jgi:hypothetical protein